MIGTDRGKGGGEGSENILMCRGRQKGIEKPRMGIGIFISKKFAYNIFVPIELCQLCSPRVGFEKLSADVEWAAKCFVCMPSGPEKISHKMSFS